MKKRFIANLALTSLCSIFLLSSAWAQYPALKLDPETPGAGSKVEFKYKTKDAEVKLTNPEAVIYLFDKNGDYKVIEPTLKNDEDKVKGEIEIPAGTVALSFVFQDDNNTDNNAKKGYFIPLAGKDNEEKAATEWVSALYYGQLGSQVNDIISNKELSLKYATNAWKLNADMGRQNIFLNTNWAALNASDPENFDKNLTKEILKLSKRKDLTEQDYSYIINSYHKVGQRSIADSITKVVIKQYPQGELAINNSARAFAQSKKTASEKLAEYQALAPNLQNHSNSKQIKSFMLRNLANQALKEKDTKTFDAALELMEPELKVSMLNSIAWDNAEKGKDLPAMAAYSKQAMEYAITRANAPATAKPDNLSTRSWKKNNQYNLGTYADTYGYILSLQGDDKGAYEAAETAAKNNVYEDAEVNDRYIKYAAKALDPNQALEKITAVAKTGNLSDSSYAVLKSVYTKAKKSDKDYDKFLTEIKAIARENHMAKLKQQMVNYAAPQFALKNLEGKEYSSKMYEGNVTVIDFWATWCGPCVRSMPGMQLAVNKFATDPKVQFFFVNTWENAEDKNANASKFIKSKGYNFNVVMDPNDRMVSDFGVEGIPAKFIVDGKGNVRFAASGFSGSNEKLAEELEMMIELARKF